MCNCIVNILTLSTIRFLTTFTSLLLFFYNYIIYRNVNTAFWILIRNRIRQDAITCVVILSAIINCRSYLLCCFCCYISIGIFSLTLLAYTIFWKAFIGENICRFIFNLNKYLTSFFFGTLMKCTGWCASLLLMPNAVNQFCRFSIWFFGIPINHGDIFETYRFVELDTLQAYK